MRFGHSRKALTSFLDCSHLRPRHRVAEIFGGRPSLFGEVVPMLWITYRRIRHLPSFLRREQLRLRIVFHLGLHLGDQKKAPLKRGGGLPGIRGQLNR